MSESDLHMTETMSTTIGPTGELNDSPYAKRCREQVAEAAHCVDQDGWRQSRFFESFSDAFVDCARNAAICIDVGAERGFYTHLARRYMQPAGRVIAIEPDPARAAALRAYYADDRNVTVILAAAAAKTGTIRLTKNGDHSASQRMSGGQSFCVETVVLDKIPEALRADLIKIDVEGAEAEVLTGMSNILSRRNCRVFVEFHPWADEITPNARMRIREIASTFRYDIVRTDISTNDPDRLVGGRMILSPEGQPNGVNPS